MSAEGALELRGRPPRPSFVNHPRDAAPDYQVRIATPARSCGLRPLAGDSGGTMASVRNPLAGFGITICVSLGLSFLAGLPVVLLPQREIVYFYLPFALFGVWLFAGRGGVPGLVGFVGATLGAFIGTYAVQLLFVPQGWPMWPADWTVLMTLAFGAARGPRARG